MLRTYGIHAVPRLHLFTVTNKTLPVAHQPGPIGPRIKVTNEIRHRHHTPGPRGDRPGPRLTETHAIRHPRHTANISRVWHV